MAGVQSSNAIIYAPETGQNQMYTAPYCEGVAYTILYTLQ